jgi:hypothetical protein
MEGKADLIYRDTEVVRHVALSGAILCLRICVERDGNERDDEQTESKPGLKPKPVLEPNPGLKHRARH